MLLGKWECSCRGTVLSHLRNTLLSSEVLNYIGGGLASTCNFPNIFGTGVYLVYICLL